MQNIPRLCIIEPIDGCFILCVMIKYKITGQHKLGGEIVLAGAKNSVSKLLVASLLTEEECVFAHVPEIGEVEMVVELCRGLGAKVERNGHELRIKTNSIRNLESPLTQSRKNRIPILTLGPLLARCGEAEVAHLGGDRLGMRPVDIHLEALGRMGAVIEERADSFFAKAPDGLHGAEISLRLPSVGATENVMFAAVLAKGKTIIRNAAREPEVKDLLRFLQKMGAIIELGANREIYIEGVSRLRGAEHLVMPDRNEAVSFACLALASGSRIFVRGAVQDQLGAFLNAIRKIGGEYEVREDGILFHRANSLKATRIETDTHPGFMTDWQQPFAVVLSQASGESFIHETVYENRFAYAQDLVAMGANFEVTEKCLGTKPCRFADQGYMHSGRIIGPTKLHGADVEVRDLRSGIVNVIAALIADGESTISGVQEIDRGYENLDGRLRSLGADIKRVDE